MRRRITPLATATLLALGLAFSPSIGRAQNYGTPFGPTTVWEYQGCLAGLACHRLFVTVQETTPFFNAPMANGIPYRGLSVFQLFSEFYTPGTSVQSVDVSRASFIYREIGQGLLGHGITSAAIAVPSVGSFTINTPPGVLLRTETFTDGVWSPPRWNGVGLDFVGMRVVAEGERAIPLAPAVVVTPEPSTYMLMGSGLLGLAGLARRKRKAQRPT